MLGNHLSPRQTGMTGSLNTRSAGLSLLCLPRRCYVSLAPLLTAVYGLGSPLGHACSLHICPQAPASSPAQSLVSSQLFPGPSVACSFLFWARPFAVYLFGASSKCVTCRWLQTIWRLGLEFQLSQPLAMPLGSPSPPSSLCFFTQHRDGNCTHLPTLLRTST